MNENVLEIGDKVHVMTRRQFPDDLRRHFAGTVQAVSDQLARVEGYVFVYHSGRNEYEKRGEKRLRILSLSDAGNIINVIPNEVEIDSLRYGMVNNRLAITDGKSFALDINEFGPAA